MVPLPEHTTVNNKPLKQLIKNEKLEKIIDRTRKGGAEIIKFLEKGSAYYAPAASGVEMAESYIKDMKKTPAGPIKSITFRRGTTDDRLRIYWADGSSSDLPCTQEQSLLA